MADIYVDVDTALASVPVNIFPLTDDTDFKTRETAVAYNAAGMDLVFNFVTTAGVMTQTAVTPTTGGVYDWAHAGDGMYTIEMPASGGASINNNTEGYGWFTGVATGVLPWRGPIIGFRSAALNDSLCDTNTTGLLAPTTAGRTLDVSATGEAGVDWANVGSPTTTVALTGTTSGLTTNAINAIADQVWDEATSGHVAAGSFGARMPIIRSSTAQAGAATTITLDASASAVDDFYNNQLIWIVSGTGVGQGRIVSDYVGATKVATVSTWATNPDNTSVFVIAPFGSIPGATAPTAAEVADAVWDEALAGHTAEASYGALMQSQQAQVGTAQAGSTSSITLDATGASATTDFYKYNIVRIRSGTGAGQARKITAYNGTSKAATVDPAWTTAPDNTSEYIVTTDGLDAATLAQIADAVWDEARSGHATAGTFGEYTYSDAIRLSGDATAADNAEAFFDGTGYAGTNNVIPTVTTVGTVTTLAGHTAQTGDAYARLGAPAGASISADIAAVKAETASILTDTGTTLDTAITTIDTVVDAIKAKTDSLTFTQAGHVDANVQRINDVTVNGDGSATPWGP